MTEGIRQRYSAARENQLNRNEARRIRTKVHEARSSSHDAGMRWPFELLQNALDGGPRAGRETVCVTLCSSEHSMVFQHDGAPFSLQDLAALLSGGSSKEFESDEKTGRFGTGFLVTHVLAEKTSLRGLLAEADVCELFSLTLDRGGDEDAILENIKQCERDLETAVPIDSVDSEPSARFEYSIDVQSEMQQGTDAFELSLPYLFATRPMLGEVTIDRGESGFSRWIPQEETRQRLRSGEVVQRLIRVDDRFGNPSAEYRVLRFQTDGDGRSACLVLLALEGNRWRFCAPGDSHPRLFREYPIRRSGFIPTAFVIDGKFDVAQERDRVAMNNEDRLLIELAFAAAPLAVEMAIHEEWKSTHDLCHFAACDECFTGKEEELNWWNLQLKKAANSLANLPVVETVKGRGPISSTNASDWYADFPLPRLDSASQIDETTLDRVWMLASETAELYPPLHEHASSWRRIIDGWAELEVEVGLATVKSIGEYARDGVVDSSDLKVSGDRNAWLSRFIDVVGECWEARAGSDPKVLNGLLPNQYGVLCSPTELFRDLSVTAELKDISESLGYDVRSTLLDVGLARSAEEQSLKYFQSAIEQAIPRARSEDDVLAGLLGHLETRIPEGERLQKDSRHQVKATIHLLDYIWRAKGARGAALARKTPLLTSDGKINRVVGDRVLMVPPSAWEAHARPFHDAYPPARLLAADYAGDEEAEVPSVCSHLVAWGLAIADPLHAEEAAELKDRGLQAIAEFPDDVANVTVTGASFPQIALLRQAVLNRVEANWDAAKAFLGLVLCYVARRDC